jgi:phage tail-like protein
MGFNKVSGLKRELGTVNYDEGGYEYTHKIPGKEKVEPITLERGVYAGDTDLYEFYRSSLTGEDFRTTVLIELLDKNGAVAQTWLLGEAWAKSWEAPDLDASSEEIAIEKITIEFECFLD